jgi:hypothetical protein
VICKLKNLTIRACNQGSTWDTYVENHPDATCFHWYGWRNALTGVLGYETHYLCAFDDLEIVGVFPFAIVKSTIFGTSAVSLPFCSYGGPLSNSVAITDLLLEAALAIATQRKAKYIEVRSFHSDIPVAKESGLYYTFQKEIPSGPPELTFVPSKRRNVIRKAIANGLTHHISDDVDTFFELYAQNAKAHGTPALPVRFFKTLFSDLGDKVDMLFVKNKEGNYEFLLP